MYPPASAVSPCLRARPARGGCGHCVQSCLRQPVCSVVSPPASVFSRVSARPRRLPMSPSSFRPRRLWSVWSVVSPPASAVSPCVSEPVPPAAAVQWPAVWSVVWKQCRSALTGRESQLRPAVTRIQPHTSPPTGTRARNATERRDCRTSTPECANFCETFEGKARKSH